MLVFPKKKKVNERSFRKSAVKVKARKDNKSSRSRKNRLKGPLKKTMLGQIKKKTLETSYKPVNRSMRCKQPERSRKNSKVGDFNVNFSLRKFQKSKQSQKLLAKN